MVLSTPFFHLFFLPHNPLPHGYLRTRHAQDRPFRMSPIVPGLTPYRRASADFQPYLRSPRLAIQRMSPTSCAVSCARGLPSPDFASDCFLVILSSVFLVVYPDGPEAVSPGFHRLVSGFIPWPRSMLFLRRIPVHSSQIAKRSPLSSSTRSLRHQHY